MALQVRAFATKTTACTAVFTIVLNYKSTTQDCKSPQAIHNYREPSQMKPTISYKTKNSRCDLGGERLNIYIYITGKGVAIHFAVVEA